MHTAPLPDGWFLAKAWADLGFWREMKPPLEQRSLETRRLNVSLSTAANNIAEDGSTKHEFLAAFSRLDGLHESGAPDLRLWTEDDAKNAGVLDRKRVMAATTAGRE
jgi:hypothetical protein